MTPAAVPSQAIPFKLLAYFNGVMLLAVLPLIGYLPFWVIVLFGVATIVRTLRSRRRDGATPLLVKLLVLAGGIGGIFVEFGSLTGIDAGLAVLVVLIALKFLEARVMRDIRVLALLGYFLLLCDLFFAQDLARWLYVGCTLLLITIGVAYSHIADGRKPVRTAAWAGFKLFAQAIPLVVLLFLFFPRIYSGFRFQFGRSMQAGTGMSDEMRPGSFASLALRQDIAFRADFPDGNPPPQADLYWRGVVLWRCGTDGLTWLRASNLSSEWRKNTAGGEAVRQRIVLQPHGGRWLFALDRPVAAPNKYSIQPGGFLQSERGIYYPLPYEVVSRPENRETHIRPDQKRQALSIPADLPKTVVDLASSFRANAENEAEIVAAALRYFQENGFLYSLTPGTYGKSPIEEFLFDRRSGFCEHYAGAFATLMRAAGIPSRVVIGYHGGQFNRHGNYVIVRQSDAHAWCEVWFEGKGWRRIDPTSVIAPDRISAGLDSYLENQSNESEDGQVQTKATNPWREFIGDVRLLWDSLAYRWDLLVLNFDEESQRSFLVSIGLGSWNWSSLITLLGGTIATLVAALGLWLWYSGRSTKEELLAWYDRLCEAVARLGVRREPWEGPIAFTERAADKIPLKSKEIREAGKLYAALRYSSNPPQLGQFVAAVEDVTKRTQPHPTAPATH